MVWTKFSGKKDSWKRLSLIGDETVIIFKAQKSTSSRILCKYNTS